MCTREIVLLAACLMALGGCRTEAELPDGYCDRVDMSGTSHVDMSPAPAKCAAGKGLAGDNLVCVDFSKVSGLNDPQLAGWDFVTNCGGMYWEISGGQLQTKDLTNFINGCGFTLPSFDLTKPPYNQYSSFSIAVSQTINVASGKQSVGIYVGAAFPAEQLWYTTGTFPPMTTTLQIAAAVLPNGGNGTFWPLFEILASMTSNPGTGWQIDSIAVNGSK